VAIFSESSTTEQIPTQPTSITLPVEDSFEAQEDDVDPTIAKVYATRDTYSKDSLLKHVSPGVDKYQLNVDESTFQHQQYLERLTQDMIKSEREDLLGFIDGQEASAEIVQDPAILTGILEDDAERASDILAPERAIARANMSFPFTKEQEDSVAAELHVMKKMAELGEGHPEWYNNVLDTLGQFFLPDLNYDLSKIDFDSEVTIQWYRGLEGEEKAMFINKLVEDLREATDDNRKAMVQILSNFIGTEGVRGIDFDLTLDGIDVALFAGPTVLKGLGRVLNKSLREANAISTAVDAETAGALNASALNDPIVADRLGIDTTVAYSNGTNFPNKEKLLPEARDDLALTTIKALTGESTTSIRERGLKTIERDYALPHALADKEKAEKLFNESKAALEAELIAKNEVEPLFAGPLQITRANKNGFSIAIPYTDEFGTPGAITKHVDYGAADSGSFGPLPKVNAFKEFLASSKYLFTVKGMKNTIGKLVESAELRDTVQGRYLKAFEGMYSEAVAPIKNKVGLLNKESQGKLEAVLAFSDEFGARGKRLTARELMYDGVIIPAKNGVDEFKITLTPNEVQTYYNMLELSDFAAMVENNSLRTQMLFNKQKYFKFGGSSRYGTVLASIGSVNKLPENEAVDAVYDSSTGWRDISSRTLTDKKIASEGKVLVKFDSPLPIKMKDSDELRYYEYGLVRPEEVGRIPTWVFPRREAYISKITPNVNYIVKRMTPGIVNGRASNAAELKTVHLFDGQIAADEKAALLNAASTDGSTYKVVRDRQFSITGTEGEKVTGSTGGGLFTGARSSEDIPFGKSELIPDRVPAFTAVMRNLQHLGSSVARNEWRLDMQAKWKKSASSAEDRPITDFNAPINETTKNGRALASMREYIRQQLRIADPHELSWESTSTHIVDWMEGKTGFDKDWNIPFKETPVNLRTSIMNTKSMSPAAAARALTFNTLIGWLNPAQLIIQAQNASIVASMFPRESLKATAGYPIFRSMIYAQDDAAMRHIAGKWGLKGEALEARIASVKAAQRTGYFDTLINTADMTMSTQGYGHTMAALKNLSDKATVFFREGEAGARGIAWEVSWQQAVAKKGSTKFSDAEIQDIFSIANDYNLNMGRASKAGFQTNPLTTTGTQFWQVGTKWVEKTILNGSAWTPKDRIKLVLGQLMLYNAASVPMGDFFLNQVAGAVGKKPEDVTKTELAFWSQGLTGVILGDGELQIAPRAAIGAMLKDITYETLLEPTSMVERFLGASSTAFGRGFDGASSMLLPMFTDQEWSPQEWAIHSSRLLTSISGLNNAQKAYFMAHSEVYYDRNFRPLLADEFSPWEIYGQALGFVPTRATTLQQAQISKRNRTDMHTKIGHAILSHINRSIALNTSDPEAGKKLQAHANQLILGLPEGDQRAVRTVLVNGIKAESKEWPLINDIMNNANSAATSKILLGNMFVHFGEDEE